MPIRWDFRKVYKNIRESKGLSQAEVCGNMMSRTVLAKFESGQSVPKFENMVFLLEQINMSYGEFKYICNYYHPSKRQEIFNKVYNQISSSETKELREIKQLCEDYLKINHDIPIERILDKVTAIINIRENGFLEPNQELQNITQKIQGYLEKSDVWYERDLKLLNAILFNFPLDILPATTDRILENLKKYPDYLPLKDTKYAILTNLASIFLHNGQMPYCQELTEMTLEIAKDSKRYDRLGFCQVRLGICKKDKELIDKIDPPRIDRRIPEPEQPQRRSSCLLRPLIVGSNRTNKLQGGQTDAKKISEFLPHLPLSDVQPADKATPYHRSFYRISGVFTDSRLPYLCTLPDWSQHLPLV